MTSCQGVLYRRKDSDSYLPKVTVSGTNYVSSSLSSPKLFDTSQTTKNETLSKCHILCRTCKGLLHIFFCSLFITLSSVIVKKMDYIDPGELSMIRNAGIFLGCLPIVIYTTDNPLGPSQWRLMLAVRGFLGATALYLNLLAFRLLPLTDAAIIISSLPALVMVMAKIFLKEPCGVIQCLALVITIIGVLISIRLPGMITEGSISRKLDINYILGMASAFGCIFFLSITLIALRHMKDIHFAVVLVYLGFIGVLENACLTAVLGQFVFPRCGMDRVWVLMVAVFGWLGHCFLTLAIQAEAVGIISVMKASIDVIMAMVLQVIFFETTPDIYNIVGAALVLLSISMIGVKKWLSGKTGTDPVRPEMASRSSKYGTFIHPANAI